MAHATFISYKYSESVDLRDRIINAMGEDAIYYKGENGFSPNKSDDSDELMAYHEEKVFDIISQNRRNQDPPVYCCKQCESLDPLTGSYISYVEEDEFLQNIDTYINNAFDKAQNDCQGYIVKPTVQ